MSPSPRSSPNPQLLIRGQSNPDDPAANLMQVQHDGSSPLSPPSNVPPFSRHPMDRLEESEQVVENRRELDG